MLTQYIHHYPALGKGEEFRALLRERVTSQNERGSSQALAIRMMAPENEALVVIRHESLAAMESYRTGNYADDGFPAFMARIEAVIAHQPVNELWDMLAVGSSEGARYAWRGRYYPSSPRAMVEMEALLLQRQRVLASKGIESNVFRQLFPPMGDTNQHVVFFKDLAQVDEHIAGGIDTGLQQRLSEISRAPSVQAMYQVAVPMPVR